MDFNGNTHVFHRAVIFDPDDRWQIAIIVYMFWRRRANLSSSLHRTCDDDVYVHNAQTSIVEFFRPSLPSREEELNLADH